MRNAFKFSKSFIIAFLFLLLPLYAFGYDGDQILDNVQPEGGGTLDVTSIKSVTAIDDTTEATLETELDHDDITGAGTVDTAEEVQDTAGGMVTGNTETRITVTYQDDDGTIDYVVDAETDPVFSLWDKSTGISITESQISDFGTYLESESDPLALLSAGTDNVKDTHIDWGTGAGQVSADDIPDGATNAIITLTQETNFETAYSHSQSAHAPATAEQNVNADWNSASGDSQILNKPTLLAADNTPDNGGSDAAGEDWGYKIENEAMTFYGIKTFDSFPITPSSAPTTDYQAANKKYVDDHAGGSMVYPGAGIPLSTGSAWGTSITNNSVNWNTAYGWGNHASAGYLTAETDPLSLLTAGTDNVKDTHIDWGTGAGQVSADDIPDGATNAIITLTQETNFGTAYTHSQVTTGNPHNLDAADVGAQPADADLTDLADGSLTASKVAGVADADYGEIVVSLGVWSLENDALDDQYYDSEADLTGLLDNNYQPLESTLTDIADGTITENLVNTANPWADNEVSDTITVGASGSVNDAAIPSGLTRDTEWDTAAKINAATTDADFLTTETDPLSLLTAGTDNVKDTHIDWGTGAGQVSADDIPDGATNAIITLTQETNFGTAYSHSQSAHAPATAEQNVNADWNSASGDSQILNKPTLLAADNTPDNGGSDAAGEDWGYKIENEAMTFYGIKTFDSFPITPSSAPTTDYQAANKKYVDDHAGGSMVYPGAGIPLSTGSAWGTSITNNSVNWNTAYGWGNHASAGYLTAETDPLAVLKATFTTDGGVLVGTGAGTYQEETGATLRTSLGLGTTDTPQFTGLNLGTGELTAGSINRASGSLTLEIGGTTEQTITATETTFGGNIVIPDAGYIGSASDTDAIQIEADGDAVLTQGLSLSGTKGIGVYAAPSTQVGIYVYDPTFETVNTHYGANFNLTKTSGVTDYADTMFGSQSYFSLNQVGGEIGDLFGSRSQGVVQAGSVGSIANPKSLYGIDIETYVPDGTVTSNVYTNYTKTNLDGGTFGADIFGVYNIVDIEAAVSSIGSSVYGEYIQIDVDKDPIGSAYGLYLYTLTNVDYAIYHNGTAPSRLGGALSVPTITLSGGQIAFPATQSASSDANTLDDYEEGTYDITVTCQTSGGFTVSDSFNKVAYIKIGKKVYIQGYISISTDNSCSGPVLFSVPFQATSSDDAEGTSVGISKLLSHGGTITNGTYINLPGSANVFNLESIDDSGNLNVLTETDVDGAWTLTFSLDYIAAN